MLMCIQNLVKFCPLVLKILSGNENYDEMTELQKDGITELQKDRQGKSSIAPTFSKRGYNDNFQGEILNIFHIFSQIIDCGYTLEPPQ